ncbi:Fe(3+)-hydroxamate ABC transporter permease FhuB [Labrys sp. LIt4]|uniref:Fe(3+)-hydroxamate ABC transporter permease FhuB n=1 Tax=Labrys sp. LIt4 TaxID=2821355 RepID=UPI001AE013F8|nr:Fe(3+)-hydroxamate ABC transporter permease FhuB [Labrys sp. LIt4]MBP0580552.1 Fe(3+)-hydroxamate ABC transporter permease FhuB [Labrys sp. LIt4]
MPEARLAASGRDRIIGRISGWIIVSAVLLGLAAALFLLNLSRQVPPAGWLALLAGADDLRAIMARDGLAPRFCAGLLGGGALGLASVVLQQVLRNPLAEPGTLGIFAGAKCAIAASIIWAPGLLALGWDLPALAGGIGVAAIVLLLSAQSDFAPTTVTLIGLVASLAFGALGTMLVLTHFDALSDLYIWEAGSLIQNGWDTVLALALKLGLVSLAILLLMRPLSAMQIEGAEQLGVRTSLVRGATILAAVGLSALVASTVGLISFLGLAGAAIARGAGARRLPARLVAGPLIAAGLLALTDQALLALAGGIEIPAGITVMLLSVPLLLWMLQHAPAGTSALAMAAEPMRLQLGTASAFIGLGAALVVSFALAATFGPGPDGWQFAQGELFAELSIWRLPRITAACCAGAMLAMAGSLLQRLTRNEMASPELLGISSGTALMLLVATLFLPGLDRYGTAALSCLACLAILACVLWLGRRSAFAPDHLLLIGAGLGALLASLLSILLVIGDPRILRVIGWLSGSTYSVDAAEARAIALATASALLLPLPLLRWIGLMQLGEPVGRSLGVPIAGARLAVVLVVAVLTGVATLFVGPLSFVGLMAPHLARLLGMRTALAEIYGSALVGAVLMILADWVGRTIAFPWQIPAGLIATGLGGAYFIVASWKR